MCWERAAETNILPQTWKELVIKPTGILVSRQALTQQHFHDMKGQSELLLDRACRP